MNLDKNIGWCTHTHNIMTGCLNQKLGICNVKACYAKQTAENPFYRRAFPYGFEPHFYNERIQEVAKLKTPAIIFMDSMSDHFGSWWKDEEILKVLRIMDCYRGVHWHKYVDLTKNPIRMVTILEDYAESDGVDRLKNVYFGTSITGLCDEVEYNRLGNLRIVHEMGYNTVLSIEPLLYNPSPFIGSAEDLNWLDWLIIGGQTKPTKIPPQEWVRGIARAYAPTGPVFLKDNLGSSLSLGYQGGILAWWNAPEPGKFQPYPRFPVDLLPIAQAWGKA